MLNPLPTHPDRRSRRPRITIHDQSWWFDDPARGHPLRLDPLFGPCGWNLRNLASTLGIGERTLSRIIEESIGQTGKTWLRHIRIVRANKETLQNTDKIGRMLKCVL